MNTSAGFLASRSTEYLDVASNTWFAGPSLRTARADANAAFYGGYRWSCM
jgi:hypothetical protein